MSNDLHLLVPDTEGEPAAWASCFFGDLARSRDAIREPSGVFFDRQYAAEPILDDVALFECLVYLVDQLSRVGWAA